MNLKPTVPQGTRDFSPEDVRKRQYIFTQIKSVFELFGFQPLETPSMENLTTLMGKYGEEGDRLIFKILNNGLHEKKEADKAKLNEEWQKMLDKPYNTPVVTEKALRYDLTIPFARYVVMHQNDISLPFRRYQIQPVWRADRPQKGRYREFWQCDADIVGTNALFNEAELLAIYREAFFKLNIPEISIKINNRKILAGLAECCGASYKLTEITVAIDKLDKIGWDGVQKELIQKGIADDKIDYIQKYLNIKGENQKSLAEMASLLATSAIAQKGIEELTQTLELHAQMTQTYWNNQVQIDFSLARGLNYYTGFIAEVATTAVKMGSIGGGGRYDNLTELFGLKGISGVGVSFGVDRIYDVMEELNLFPEELAHSTQILFLNIDNNALSGILAYLKTLRNANIATEMYPDVAKFDKQMKYANKRGIPYVAIIGESELVNGNISLKNMISGEQKSCQIEEIVQLLAKK